jgi:hypothetical protein
MIGLERNGYRPYIYSRTLIAQSDNANLSSKLKQGFARSSSGFECTIRIVQSYTEK